MRDSSIAWIAKWLLAMAAVLGLPAWAGLGSVRVTCGRELIAAARSGDLALRGFWMGSGTSLVSLTDFSLGPVDFLLTEAAALCIPNMIVIHLGGCSSL